MSSNKDRFLTLDAMRGLAGISIAYFHILPTWPGYLAVDFFLVLSGFILSHVYRCTRPSRCVSFNSSVIGSHAYILSISIPSLHFLLPFSL